MPTARPGTGAENFLDGSHVAEQRPCFCRGGIVAAVTLCAARTAMQVADATISPLKAPCPIESESDIQCQAGRGVAQVDALLPELEGSEVPRRVAALAGFPCTCLTENASMSDAYRDIASRIALDRRELAFCAAEAASSNEAAMRVAPGKPAPPLDPGICYHGLIDNASSTSPLCASSSMVELACRATIGSHTTLSLSR